MARAIAGDPSDNLLGVPRAGLKTVASRFPIFREHNRGVCFDSLYQACIDTDSKAKIYENILNYKDRIETNYKMMQLYSPLISAQNKYVVNEAIFSSKLQFNKTGIYKMMADDGFGSYDWDPLFLLFRSIITSEVNAEGPTEVCVTCEKNIRQEHPWVEDKQAYQTYPVCSEQCKEDYVSLC
jgi:5'-3' exonuclease